MSLLAGTLDFRIPGSLLAAIGAALLQPLFLLAIARVPALAERNALQFLLSAAGALAVWLAVLSLAPSLRGEAAIGLMGLAAAMLLYLEIWGLMSRGYTLSLLLTLHDAGRPLAIAALRLAYRGGDGLGWILRHRLGGMMSAGLIEQRGADVVLLPRGTVIVRLYLCSVTALGLKRTG